MKEEIKVWTEDIHQELYDSWINGNRNWVRKQFENKSKLFALDMVEHIAFATGDYKTAINEVKEMV